MNFVSITYSENSLFSTKVYLYFKVQVTSLLFYITVSHLGKIRKLLQIFSWNTQILWTGIMHEITFLEVKKKSILPVIVSQNQTLSFPKERCEKPSTSLKGWCLQLQPRQLTQANIRLTEGLCDPFFLAVQRFSNIELTIYKSLLDHIYFCILLSKSNFLNFCLPRPPP